MIFFFLPSFLLLQGIPNFPFNGLKQKYNLIHSIGKAQSEVNSDNCVPELTICTKNNRAYNIIG